MNDGQWGGSAEMKKYFANSEEAIPYYNRPIIYRAMTWKERILGREPDTDDVVVAKNYTLAEWFFGRNQDRSMRILTAIQRSVGLAGIVVLIALASVFIFRLLPG